MSKKKLLVIGYVWPEPTSSAAGARMMQLLEFFLAEGYFITFATTAAKTEFMADLTGPGIASEKIELNNKSFDDFLKTISPEIVIFDRFMMEEQFGWRVAEVCPDAIRIMDTEDLHFLRKARQEAFKKKMSLTPHLLFSESAKREIASIYRCDLSLIISKTETELLQETFNIPEQLLFYLPFMISNKISGQQLSFEERKDFISIGNFLHAPNKDAVVRLKKEIWPLIKKKLPKAKLHIFGAYVPQEILQMQNDREGFLVHGRAVSAKAEIGKARVLLAPLNFGAGLKGKFIDAMEAGTPTVTTNIGTEGMKGDLPWNGFFEDDSRNFADAAVELYKNKDLWKECRNRGYSILEREFSLADHRERFRNLLVQLNENLQQHRLKNFTGQMLQHHTLQSSKLLSKYIEAKNRNRP